MFTKIREWFNREPIDLDAMDGVGLRAVQTEREKAHLHASVTPSGVGFFDGFDSGSLNYVDTGSPAPVVRVVR